MTMHFQCGIGIFQHIQWYFTWFKASYRLSYKFSRFRSMTVLPVSIHTLIRLMFRQTCSKNNPNIYFNNVLSIKIFHLYTNFENILFNFFYFGREFAFKSFLFFKLFYLLTVMVKFFF